MTLRQVRLIARGVLLIAVATMHPCAMAQCEVARLNAPDGTTDARFGAAVAISADTLIAGVPYDDDLGEVSGSAYIFERTVGVWRQTAKLRASDGEAGDRFGDAVSIDGDIAIVGASGDDDLVERSGSAYIFERIVGVWRQTAKLRASDGDVGDFFGEAVSISGDIAIVGARWDDDFGASSGSAYIFEKITGVWTQTAKLVASDGARQDWFGDSVSISGDTAFVGAPFDDDRGTESGSAYVFEKVTGIWTQTAKFFAPDSLPWDHFGYSVSISGDSAFVGAIDANDLGSNSGSVYIYENIRGVWTHTDKLLASDGASTDHFGISVSISGDTAIVGATNDDEFGSNSGAAYVIKRIRGVWTEVVKLLASDGAAEDAFGIVAISGDTAIVGAPGDDYRFRDSGSVYVFDLDCEVLQLQVTATCPSGGPIRVSWSGATGGGTIALLYARNTGSFVIPINHRCAGTVLGLGEDQIDIAFHGAAGPRGRRIIDSNADPSTCGGHLQLLDLTTCGTSNVARIE